MAAGRPRRAIAMVTAIGFALAGTAFSCGAAGGRGTAAAATAAGSSSAPTISQTAPLSLSGAGVWLHAVVDSENRVVLSAEQSQSVEMAYFDPANPTNSPSWKTVITPSMVGATGLADHWHVYANGHHWIVVSTNTANASWLFEFDDSFTLVGKVQVVSGGQPASNSVQAPTSQTVLTNDMFMVAEPTGVTVAHFLPGTGHRLFRYNFALQLQSIKDIGGGKYTHTNGASAFATPSGFTEIAPTSLAPNLQSSLEEIVYDVNWNPLSLSTLVSVPNANVVMGTAQTLSGGYSEVTARVITPVAGSPNGSDAGNIVRYIFDPNGNQVASTTLDANADGNRPHTLLYQGTTLLTGWDTASSGARIEVDMVSGGGTTTTSPGSTTSSPTTAPGSTTTTSPPPPSPGGAGYWMLAGGGTVYPFGSAATFGNAVFAGGNAQAIVSTPDKMGYWVVNDRGQVVNLGDAPAMTLSGAQLPAGVVAIARTPDGQGLWAVTGSGQVLTAGDAPKFGAPADSGIALAKGIVSMAATPDGKGYWLLGGDGGVFAYGDAGFFGSTGNIALNKPAIAMTPTPDSKGYWFVASDGGIFGYGDAGYFGSMGATTLARPVIGIVVTADGKGYWLSASDGGVFAFGDAGFVGSLGGNPPSSPIVGFAS